MLIDAEQTEEILQREMELRPMQSQATFSPTPFSETEWEVVGKRIEVVEFMPMDVEVIESELTRPDPMFADFGGGVAGKSQMSLGGETQQEDSEPVIDEALLEAVRAEAFEAGRLQGREEAMQEASQQGDERHSELLKELKQFELQLVREVKTVAARTEKCGFELALSIARKILATTAEARPEYILDVIRSALESTGAGKALRVRVSPQDYEFLEVIGLPPDLSSEETGVTYVADESIASGCVVETDFGLVDHRLEEMWAQVKESLFSAVK